VTVRHDTIARMSHFIRQVALVAREIDPVVDDLRAVFGLAVPFNDPGVGVFGLRNAVFPVGDTFLEVVSPVQADASAARYLARRGGDGGYMAILQTDDLQRDRERLAALGIRIVWETTLPDIATIHLHPRDVGGAIVSLDEPRPPESWRWAGPGWEDKVRTKMVRRITGIDVQAAEPERLARRWGQALGNTPALRNGEIFILAWARSHIRFLPIGDGRGEGILAVEIAAADPERVRAVAAERGCLAGDGSVRIGGVEFRLR
jgi:hypothetical protein